MWIQNADEYRYWVLGNGDWKGNPKIRREICPSVTLSTINSQRIPSELEPDLRV